jgi:hypothetical protein
MHYNEIALIVPHSVPAPFLNVKADNMLHIGFAHKDTLVVTSLFSPDRLKYYDFYYSYKKAVPDELLFMINQNMTLY